VVLENSATYISRLWFHYGQAKCYGLQSNTNHPSWSVRTFPPMFWSSWCTRYAKSALTCQWCTNTQRK
jgi:tellurite resistance protein TehA-like permease